MSTKNLIINCSETKTYKIKLTCQIKHQRNRVECKNTRFFSHYHRTFRIITSWLKKAYHQVFTQINIVKPSVFDDGGVWMCSFICLIFNILHVMQVLSLQLKKDFYLNRHIFQASIKFS